LFVSVIDILTGELFETWYIDQLRKVKITITLLRFGDWFQQTFDLQSLLESRWNKCNVIKWINDTYIGTFQKRFVSIDVNINVMFEQCSFKMS
jgi:hypothetical protein